MGEELSHRSPPAKTAAFCGLWSEWVNAPEQLLLKQGHAWLHMQAHSCTQPAIILAVLSVVGSRSVEECEKEGKEYGPRCPLDCATMHWKTVNTAHGGGGFLISSGLLKKFTWEEGGRPESHAWHADAWAVRAHSNPCRVFFRRSCRLW